MATAGRTAPAIDAHTAKLPGGGALRFETAAGVFRPTYTSQLFINAAATLLKAPTRMLDLGCGCGVVGVALARLGLVVPPLYASDVSASAVALAATNAAAHAVDLDGRCGSLFEPWKGMTFACIIDDVSGVAADVARLSPWFADQVPCDAGADGTDLTRRILADASAYLDRDGMMLFPVISLSDTTRILDSARSVFRTVERVAADDWRLPPEMHGHLETLRAIKRDGRIRFEEKFGMVVCRTEIYRCGDPLR